MWIIILGHLVHLQPESIGYLPVFRCPAPDRYYGATPVKQKATPGMAFLNLLNKISSRLRQLSVSFWPH
jgi:hypothetical protein